MVVIVFFLWNRAVKKERHRFMAATDNEETVDQNPPSTSSHQD
jgi:hypothetical protein